MDENSDLFIMSRIHEGEVDTNLDYFLLYYHPVSDGERRLAGKVGAWNIGQMHFPVEFVDSDPETRAHVMDVVYRAFNTVLRPNLTIHQIWHYHRERAATDPYFIDQIQWEFVEADMAKMLSHFSDIV